VVNPRVGKYPETLGLNQGTTSGDRGVLAQGQTQGSAPRVHQQALATSPFGNTREADAVSPEATMRGL
jgi:hypothetical protein